MALTDKQLLFINAYIETLNATKAAIAAGYSQKTARSQGARLLTNVDIREAVDKVLRENAMSAGEVLARLTDQARIDLSDYMDAFGEVDIVRLREDGKAQWIKGVKHTRNGINIEFHDRYAALVELGRYHTLFTDKTDLTSGGEKLAAPVIFLPQITDDDTDSA